MEIEHELVLTELPFDQYQRYKVVEDIAATIKDLTGRERLKVLDVGGSPGLIEDFLPGDDTIVLDILRCDRRRPELVEEPNPSAVLRTGFVQGDGRAAPFGDGSFDLVTCLDTLEHVPRESREALVLELLRVSRDFMVIIAPFADENVQLAEQILDEFIRQTLKVEHEQLKEHLAYGLPRQGHIVQLLEEEGVLYIDFPSGYLYNWLIMMIVKHYLLSLPGLEQGHRMVDKFYNLNFSEDDHKAPSYRHVLVVSKRGDGEALDRIRDGFALVTEASADENLLKLELFQALMKLLDLRTATRLEELQRQLSAKEEHIAHLEQELADLRDLLERIKRGRVMRVMNAIQQFVERGE